MQGYFSQDLKMCPKCQRTHIAGNYCSECGTALCTMPKNEITCPCCQGTGKIKEYGEMWARWQASEPRAVLNNIDPGFFKEN